MGIVNEIGDQVSRGVKGISDNIDPPNYVTWVIIPFVFSYIIFSMLIGPLIFKNFTSTTMCEKKENNKNETCKKVTVSKVFRIFIIFIIVTIISVLIATTFYKIGLYIKNPKLAMGIETTKLVKDAIS